MCPARPVRGNTLDREGVLSATLNIDTSIGYHYEVSSHLTSFPPPKDGDTTRFVKRTSASLNTPVSGDQRMVLSQLDEPTTVEALALMTGFEDTHVMQILHELEKQKLIEWAIVTRSSGRPRSTSAVQPNATSQSPSGTHQVSSTIEAPAFDAPTRSMTPIKQASLLPDNLEPAVRKVIDQGYAKLAYASHYEILNLERAATREQVRDAYFSLSRVYHPDSYYGKQLGQYLARMEAVFRRLTQAYEVLSKKSAREEYDAYLKRQDGLKQAQQMFAEARRSAAPITSDASETKPPRAISQTLRSPSAGHDAARDADAVKRRAAARIHRMLSNPPHNPRTGTTPKPNTPTPKSPVPGAVSDPGRREQALRNLAASLKTVAEHTGGRDKVATLLERAQIAEQAKAYVEAMNSLRLACDLVPSDNKVNAEYRRVRNLALQQLAADYEKQAIYEESQNLWAAAASSWAKVTAGRPDDGKAHKRAAEAYYNSGDLHKARDHAQEAVLRLRQDADAHMVFGRILLEAGLRLNAKRELEIALKLDSKNPMIRDLLKKAKD